jgi:enterochelin esterase-like enzyme
MRYLLMLAAMLLLPVGAWAQEGEMKTAAEHVAFGRLLEYKDFPSRCVAARSVFVWLPEGYDGSRRYDVVYMHDGQMLFDSTATWNHQAWDVDRRVTELTRRGVIRPCIVVGVWNIPDRRFFDYFPQKTLGYMEGGDYAEFDKQFDASKFDADGYLKFLVTELKPYIDRHFSTYSDKAHTFLMGSSMGGLISLYGLCEYPDVFGGAACLSMHSVMVTSSVMAERNVAIAAPAFCRYLAAHLPKANSARIYIDYGDKTLDALYPPYQKRIDEVLRTAGWSLPNWTTNFYPGMAHTETDWSRRLFVPLAFLLEE